MEELKVRARAKINLALDIKGKRDDGYHEISTIMQSIALYDEITIKKVYKPDYIKLVTNLSWLPTGKKNLVYQAVEYLKETFEIETGIFVNLTKHIPASAGLGGGSADCAATLMGVRDLFKLPISDEELMEISARFGADVPFCIRGGTAHATGVGEVITPLPPLHIPYIVLAKPPIIVSTEDVFKNFKQENVQKPIDVEKVIYYIHQGDLAGVCSNMGNVLESVTESRYPIVGRLKEDMMEKGAIGAMMSGSGSSVFGVFKSKQDAEESLKDIKEKYPDIVDLFITRSI
ncbi:MAG: 4-(cytidine 5'-diphospho)-2-C-methyl-D-erythritol kinase [Defluviitaleaceae bacterium]|nr:4-(cytidine 5'-diphospho)-2-C-methyl-D-erythritol kinase [Defluviitaleaceae bacterium]